MSYWSKRYATDLEYRKKRILQATNWNKINKQARAKVAKKRNQKAWKQNRDKMMARACISQQVKRGNRSPIWLLKCSNCGEQARHYHHPKGYSLKHRYDVIPLCIKCHVTI